MQITSSTPSANRGSRRISRESLLEGLQFLLFVSPNLLLFSVFTFWPILFTLYLSFTDWNMIRPVKRLVGLANYEYLLSSPTFYKVALNTFTYATATVLGQLALGLLLAVLLFQNIRGRAIFRTAIFLPYITTTAAVAIVWIFIFDPEYGLLTPFLGAIGLASPRWLSDPAWALPAIIVVGIWKMVGFSTVIYLAGLSSVDGEIQEASRVEGANEWQVFRFITFPLLAPITFFLTVTGLIRAIQTFDIPAVMTNGGPLNATNLYVYHLYELSFEQFRAGRASALAMIFFIVLITITVFQLRLARRLENG